MVWNPLAGMTKVAIAGTIAGGVLVSGIAWQGDTAVQTTRDALDTMESRLQTAMADNEFLRGQFSSLQAIYQSDLAEANKNIKDLKATRLDLQTQLADLNNQIETDASTDVEAQAELQAEVNRLEGELDKANQAIAELEAYALETVNDPNNQYTAVDQTAYQVEDLSVEATRSWTEDASVTTAINYSEANLEVMRNETNLQTMEANYRDNYQRNITFVGITTYEANGNIYLAYVVQPDNSDLNAYNEEVNAIMLSMQYTDVMYFVNESGVLVGTQHKQ